MCMQDKDVVYNVILFCGILYVEAKRDQIRDVVREQKEEVKRVMPKASRNSQSIDFKALSTIRHEQQHQPLFDL